MLSTMAFSASTAAPDDVQTAQGSGHLLHHQRLRAAVLELRNAGLALEGDVPELARDAVAAAIRATGGATTSSDDAGDTITIDTSALARRGLTQKPITANYTVIAADLIDTVLHVTANSAITITLPTGLTTEIAIPWRQFGQGQVTFVAASGGSLLARGGANKAAGQYSGGVVTAINSTAWLLEGDITS